MEQHLELSRKIGAVLFSLAAAGSAGALFFMDGLDVPFVAWGWIGLLALAPILLLVGRLGTQILGRAILWANLIFGTVLCVAAHSSDRFSSTAFALVVASGLGLLVLGMSGLEGSRAREGFAPKAFRGTLLAIMIMALSDTTTLLFWGGLASEASDLAPVPFFLGGGLVMALAVYGLARLRTWGFLLNIGANLAIAVGAWLAPHMPMVLAVCLSATALGQLLVGAPLVRAILKGGQPEAPMNRRRASALSAALILLIMTGALAMMVAR